ncbi:RNA polymerase sigma factor [Gimesia panareensis]|uniref:ECF RNA polymerase sigma factor SigR n=1 Tax=Gimesia panareensis TaxID=2527978 RepID=A0A517Q4Q8_9PLAN|nr:RNA polymerase sigma factor [Gimesia panareensis]QDT26589.1 ECF RNA polymerase sigma factor SigR [Gimesia panareensis]QDU50532.1 ECF RNA polymerase sigma factor SigR [Gimesia panareensis]
MATGNDGKLAPEIVHQLFETHAGELRAFLTGMLRDHDLADEAFQLTFSKALQSGGQSREETRKGWLFRVAYHEAMALIRRNKIHRKSLNDLCQMTSGSLNESPDQRLLDQEHQEQIRQALASLPENQRVVVIARIYENRTFKEISEELEIPLGTVLTRMRLAIKTLSRQLDPPSHES